MNSLFFSKGSLGSKIIAVLFGVFFACLSMQLIVILSLASLNHDIFAFLKSQSTTLDHFLFQIKFCDANSSQKVSGLLTDFLYESSYFLRVSI